MKTMILGTMFVLLALAPLASAHVTNDSEAGGCPDNGSVHAHPKCYSLPGGVLLMGADVDLPASANDYIALA